MAPKCLGETFNIIQESRLVEEPCRTILFTTEVLFSRIEKEQKKNPFLIGKQCYEPRGVKQSPKQLSSVHLFYVLSHLKNICADKCENEVEKRAFLSVGEHGPTFWVLVRKERTE